jgi:hypothetical protein
VYVRERGRERYIEGKRGSIKRKFFVRAKPGEISYQPVIVSLLLLDSTK